MARIFIVIATVVFLMTALTGIGIFLLTQSSINEAENDAFDGLARGVAQSITTRASLLTQTLENISQSPELISALQQSDLPRAKQIVAQMSPYLPGAMVFRLLLPTDTEPDTSLTPHLGYADLDLVKNTFQKSQLPLIQGEKGKNRHLAIAQGIKQDDNVIAVILASVSFSQLQNSLKTLTNSRIYLELKQADFVLFSQGDNELKSSQNPVLFDIPKTAWKINYWSDNSIDLSYVSLVLTIILLPAFISVLACYVCYRKLEALLIGDQRSALNATKDIMMGKAQGNYPIELKEMSNFVSNLIQFKRVFDNGSIGADNAIANDKLELDNFFGESEHSNFLETSGPGAFGVNESNIATTGSAIVLPEENKNDSIHHETRQSQKTSKSNSNQIPPEDVNFRAYDIRDIVDEALTEDIVYDIGVAVGKEAASKGISTIVTAKDGQTSSPALNKALVDGILSTGTQILDIGTVPSSVLYFVAHHNEAHSGVILAGGNNPADKNALKIILVGDTLDGDKIQALKQQVDNNGEISENHVSANDYISAISSPITLPDDDSITDIRLLQGFSGWDPSLTNTIFRAYDIRGIVGETLTKDIVYDIGRAVGSEAVDKNISTIVFAKDGRLSSPELSKTLAEGILSTGTDILDIGTVPTPVLYFVAQHHDAHSGVMLTGSHNPAEYNGLKIVLDGETLASEKIQALKQRIDDNDFRVNDTGSVTENDMFTNEYIGVIADDIRIARPMKVVVDAGNGVAGELGPILLKTLGCEVIELYCDIDGTFPNHHPDPSKPDNLTDLMSIVKHYQADLGIAFDGDGDRLGVVDSGGKIIWPDRQMMLFSKHILATKPGAEIIYDVKCSRNLAAQIKAYGGRPTMWKTGHSFMKAKVKQTMAAFAGEMSGHLFFNDRWFGFDDGLYSAARLVELLSEDTRSSAEVFADFPDSPNTPELNIDLEEGENFEMIEQLISNASFSNAQITDIDGLRVDFDDGFGLVRASNTTPSLVVRFEGDTAEALTRIQEQFRQLILQIKPNLSLPF